MAYSDVLSLSLQKGLKNFMIGKRNFELKKANLNLGTKNKKFLSNTLTFSFVLIHSYITAKQLEIHDVGKSKPWTWHTERSQLNAHFIPISLFINITLRSLQLLNVTS